jgi:hypothetical protein
MVPAFPPSRLSLSLSLACLPCHQAPQPLPRTPPQPQPRWPPRQPPTLPPRRRQRRGGLPAAGQEPQRQPRPQLLRDWLCVLVHIELDSGGGVGVWSVVVPHCARRGVKVTGVGVRGARGSGSCFQAVPSATRELCN